MTTQNTGTTSREKKPIYLFVFLRLTQSAYQDLLHLYPFFLHKMYVTSFLWLEKIPLYMETVYTFPILLSPWLSYCGQCCNAISLGAGVSS